MSNVLRLVRRDNFDSIVVLKGLLQRAISGDLAGLALCCRTPDGVDEVLFTGAYAAHPDMALSATMRLSWRITQQQDEAHGM